VPRAPLARVAVSVTVPVAARALGCRVAVSLAWVEALAPEAARVEAARVVAVAEPAVAEPAVAEAVVVTAPAFVVVAPVEPVPVEAVLAEAVAEAVLGETARAEVVAAEGAGEAAAVAVAVAPRVAVRAGKRRALLPPECAGDGLERREGRVEVFRGNRVDDLGADAVDQGAEALLGGAAVVGECPALAVGRDPAAVDQAVQLVRVERAVVVGGAVDDVEQAPVAARDALAVERGGELGRHETVDGLQPVAEGAGLRGVWGVCGGGHCVSSVPGAATCAAVEPMAMVVG